MTSSPLRFFDCNVVVGRTSAPDFESWLDPETLLSEMAYTGIAEALVSHSFGKEFSAASGNAAVADVVVGRPTLHPSWTMFPRHAGLEASEAEQVDRLLASGARAVRLHPNPTAEIMDETVHARHYPLDEVAAGPALTALADHHIPVFLEMGQVRWEEVYAVCAAYPQLPVVVINMSYTHKRSLFAGLYHFPNLHFELSGYHVHQGLEEVCDEFGAEQVLFGTRLPVYTAGSALAMVLYAEISRRHQELIAGDNLRALLAGVRR